MINCWLFRIEYKLSPFMKNKAKDSAIFHFLKIKKTANTKNPNPIR